MGTTKTKQRQLCHIPQNEMILFLCSSTFHSNVSNSKPTPVNINDNIKTKCVRCSFSTCYARHDKNVVCFSIIHTTPFKFISASSIYVSYGCLYIIFIQYWCATVSETHRKNTKNAPKLNSSLLGPVLDFGSRMKTGCFNFYLLI